MTITNTNNQVQLHVSGNKTGTDESIRFNDISGNLISEIGMNNVTTQAKNAEYYLDGTLQSSQSNTITLVPRKGNT